MHGMLKNLINKWLSAGGPSALTALERLIPSEGRHATFYPPTFALEERVRKRERSSYVIDNFEDGTNTCLIDTVQSQANRLEPIFKEDKYKKLVPQITVEAGNKVINLLDAGHRIADSIVRYSKLKNKLDKAFKERGEKGNSEPIAKIAPTSLVFGAWDSRLTQVKIPRILRSEIRAFNVDEVKKSATYKPPIQETEYAEVVSDKEFYEKHKSEWGLAHVPAGELLGGVVLRPNGYIERNASLNLITIRELRSTNPERTKKLQKYILGLCLITFAMPQEYSLRQGCLLTRDPKNPPVYEEVNVDGKRKQIDLQNQSILKYAKKAAKEFEVGKSRQTKFVPEKLREEVKKKKAQKKA